MAFQLVSTFPLKLHGVDINYEDESKTAEDNHSLVYLLLFFSRNKNKGQVESNRPGGTFRRCESKKAREEDSGSEGRGRTMKTRGGSSCRPVHHL